MPKPKYPLTESEWADLERIISRSVRGLGVDPYGEKLIKRARAEDADRYRALHAEVKGVEIDSIRNMGRSS